MVTPDEVRAVPLFASLVGRRTGPARPHLADIRLNAGEYAVHEGGERALYAVLSGRIEVVKRFDGVERTLGWRLPGTIFGEVPLAFATPFPGGYRAAEPSRVMRLEPHHYFAIASSAPEVAEKVGALARERIGGLQGIAHAAAQGTDHRLRRALGSGLQRPAPLPVAQPDRSRLAVARDAGPRSLLDRQPARRGRLPGRAAGRRHAGAQADDARTGRAAGPADPPRRGRLRHADHRRRARRPGRRGVRRQRGPAHAGHRARSARRASRHLVAHRELPGLSQRRIRRRTGQPRAAAGAPAGRRDPRHAKRRKHRPGDARGGPRRRRAGARAQRHRGHRRVVAPAGDRRLRPAHRQGHLLRRRAQRGARRRTGRTSS